ncbi:Fur family transcriptional regulator [Lishizhenia tianjinensis]|nr:transcriptional repressor [Lishizhenia tianjinensis]
MDIFSKKNIRPTTFRKEIVSIFEAKDHAITTKEIEEALGKHDRITLYRTLKLFIENGVIHEITLPNEEKTYALCEEECADGEHQHEHLHFKCEVCERIYCIELPQAPQFDLKNFIVKSMEINLRGICDHCN